MNLIPETERHVYTQSENGASNTVLGKIGMKLMETYTAEDGIKWSWWLIEKKIENRNRK